MRLLRLSAAVALVASVGLWVPGGPWWVGLVLLVLFTQTSSMMSLTEAAMAHLVAGNWGRYGRIRLWGSAGFLATVLAAGAWFEKFGMAHFPAWAGVTLLAVLLCTVWLPDVREKAHHEDDAEVPLMPVLEQPVVRWFFAALLFHITSQFAIYGFLSLYLDSLGYSKAMIGALWAVSILVEIAWFFAQGRLIGKLPMPRWLMVCAVATILRMGMTGGLGDWLVVLFIGQLLQSLTFAAHHTCCIAFITHHFPGRLRGRGQALFTVIGYGVGGVSGVLAGGWIASHWGFEAMFGVAAVLGLLALICSWRVDRLEQTMG